jgi:predicted transposase/invertase (TIGR01784 family)
LDVRARDSDGRWLNVEMQVTVFGGLLQRLVYYACSLYVDQLESGQGYADLRPAISICLLAQVLFPDTAVPHHRFRLVDREHARELAGAIEVHTVELLKYNRDVASISTATAIEQWAFFFLFADQYEPERLRELLPGSDFQQAVNVIEAIALKTEDRMMYDQREKAQRDYLWALDGARNEGRQEGCELGLLAGKVQVLQQLLNQDPNPTESLLDRSTEELAAMLNDLQQQLRSRG